MKPHNQNENESKGRSFAPPRNFFTPGAGPATAAAGASRSQAISPVISIYLVGVRLIQSEEVVVERRLAITLACLQ